MVRRGVATSTAAAAAAVATKNFVRQSSSTARGGAKDLWILRHGQATHNPRAEAAKAAGCSFDEFFELMRQDDSLDSPLTEHGREQATAVYKRYGHHYADTVELVVSSPLSRALETANLALPPVVDDDDKDDDDDTKDNNSISSSSSRLVTKRVCYEDFREVNGVLQNAKRRTVSELKTLFQQWDFDSSGMAECDESWTADTLEDLLTCGERGFASFHWLWHERPERSILLVAHGGILRYTLNDHPNVVVQDERRKMQKNGEEPGCRSVMERFRNCELRRYRFAWEDGKILLTEVDLDHDEDSFEDQDAVDDSLNTAVVN